MKRSSAYVTMIMAVLAATGLCSAATVTLRLEPTSSVVSPADG